MQESNKDVQEAIKELSTINNTIERLFEKLPTKDHKILAELDGLMHTMTRVLHTKTTAEKGTILYEQAVGRAMSLKERYLYKQSHGGLRKS